MQTDPAKIYLTVNGARTSLAKLMQDTTAATRVVLDNCPGITALPDLPAATRVVLDNCPGITALPDLPAATEVALYNCPGITAYAGKDARNYGFYLANIRGLHRVVAGCRNLSIEEARQHWGKGGRSDRPDCLALVEKLAALVEVRSSAA